MNNLPLGMFDSGIGGLTVLASVKNLMPYESILYFGDTARVPYGNKSPETIIRYSIEIADFLVSHGIKMLVVACNTATAHALDVLQKRYSIPVIGVIDPGAKAATKITKNKHIAVLATKATIASSAYQHAIKEYLPDATIVAKACPLLVPLVEEGYIDKPATTLIVREYLEEACQTHIDTLLLGCTHYPRLKQLFKNELGNSVTIVDSATTCAEEIHAFLKHEELLRDLTDPSYTYFASDDPEKFQRLGAFFLGEKIDVVEPIPHFIEV